MSTAGASENGPAEESPSLAGGSAPAAVPGSNGNPRVDALEEPAAADLAAAAALPDVPEPLLAGYLDAALAALRAASPTDLPGALRQYQAWTPRRLRHPRVLALVRRSLEVDPGFRTA
ncbi:MAG TPA: hypothetical protein VGR68_05210, partial [Actinomycetota bacterium]|nr:hypothetical protein [Actinomycetota bacterium]